MGLENSVGVSLNLDVAGFDKSTAKITSDVNSIDKSFANASKTITSETTKWTTTLEDANGTVLKLTGNFKELKNTLGYVVNSNGQFAKSTKNLSENQKATVKTTQKYTTQLKETKNALSEQKKITNGVISENNKLQSALNKSTKETASLKQQVESLKQSQEGAKKTTGNLDLSFRSLGETLVKVAKFKIVTELLMAFVRAGEECVEIIENFDKALTEFRKVSDLSGDSLDEYTKKLGDLGDAVASTTTSMVEASTEFVKSGFSESQSAELAQLAELYRNIADEEITAGESASFIISQMKAFNNESTEFAEHTINAVNSVSNQMAVSSSDITTALTKTSSAMSVLGNSYEETIALTA